MMKPYRNADVIKAWLDGKECEYWSQSFDEWQPIKSLLSFFIEVKVRIKPEPKPDFSVRVCVNSDALDGLDINVSTSKKMNLLLTFDGETNEFKSAKVIK